MLMAEPASSVPSIDIDGDPFDPANVRGVSADQEDRERQGNCVDRFHESAFPSCVSFELRVLIHTHGNAPIFQRASSAQLSGGLPPRIVQAILSPSCRCNNVSGNLSGRHITSENGGFGRSPRRSCCFSIEWSAYGRSVRNGGRHTGMI